MNPPMKRPSKASWYRLLAELFRVPEGYEDEDGFHFGPQDPAKVSQGPVPEELFSYLRAYKPRVGRTVRDQIAAMDDGVSTGLN